jgi:hypothetical protein
MIAVFLRALDDNQIGAADFGRDCMLINRG